MTIDRRWYVVAAVVLSLSVAYLVGKRQGELDTQLGVNHTQIRGADSVTKSVTSRVDTARKKDAVLDSAHDVVRQKVRVVHDTLYVPDTTGADTSDEAIYSPAIAKLIATDDSLISAQKHELAVRDTLEASLYQGRALRDERIRLLESRGTSRFSHGLQAGVGYCATPHGNTPCIYAGYGVQVRLP